jgi:uncharacterized protein YdeI (YjbR/CyaY-like superfamily)
MPRDVVNALGHVKGLLNVFRKMRPSCRMNYIEWITTAKKEGTRKRRIDRLIDEVANYGRRHRIMPARL